LWCYSANSSTTSWKKLDKGRWQNVRNISPDIEKTNEPQRKAKKKELSNQGKGPQCFGCEGYGHLESKCPTHLKKQQKGHYVSWFNDEEESNEESGNFVAALTGRRDSDKDPYGVDITYDELFDSYEDMCHEVLK